MPKLKQFREVKKWKELKQFDEVKKWTVVCTPLAVFTLVLFLAFWSMLNRIPEERFERHVETYEGYPDLTTDCDVCLVVRMGDNGSHPASEKNLPFTLLHRLFDAVRKIKKPVQREKIVCVGVDHPSIVCRMVRDELGPNANCWQFEKMPQRETPVNCNNIVVGSTRQYLAQAHASEDKASRNFRWQEMHLVDLDARAPESHPPALDSIRPTIVTGFSANHLSVGLLLLRSIAKAAFDAKRKNPKFTVSVVIWAMEEFRGKDKVDLECMLKELDEKWKLEVEVRRFKFWTYPEWMRIKQAREGFNEFGTGEYAWKAEMIHTVLLERGLVLWTDAGDRFRNRESLTETLDYIGKNGFATRSSGGNISSWTRNEMIQYLRASKVDKSKTNCDASAMGFTLRRYEELVRPWYDCAITRQCIAPDGSNRRNHRQDQAALTILIYLSNNTCAGIHGGLNKHTDWKLEDSESAVPTSCYLDPRQG